MGNPDQGPQKSPRFTVVEFKNQLERNEVKNASNLLNQKDETKTIASIAMEF